MFYGQLYDCDPGNGPGLRTTLFVSGCTHYCNGCFNKCAWDFHYGKFYTSKTEAKVIQMLKNPYCHGLTILGGEPMEPDNQPEVLNLLIRVRQECPDKDIWLYSGYLFEELIGAIPSRAYLNRKITMGIMERIDTLVDGEFKMAEKDVTLDFRGSRNQRIINVPKSLETGDVVIRKEYK